MTVCGQVNYLLYNQHHCQLSFPFLQNRKIEYTEDVWLGLRWGRSPVSCGN